MSLRWSDPPITTWRFHERKPANLLRRVGRRLQQRNRVLRNTYWLLALSLLPTVLGAWVGVATGVTAGDGRRHER